VPRSRRVKRRISKIINRLRALLRRFFHGRRIPDENRAETRVTDLLYTTASKTDAGSKAQWEAFALDPAGDGTALPYIQDIVGFPNPDDDDEPFPAGTYVRTRDVHISHWIDDNGNQMYHARLTGNVAGEDIVEGGLIEHPDKPGTFIRQSKERERYRTGGTSRTFLLERKRGRGGAVWASANVAARQQGNVFLVGDQYDGTLEGNIRGPDSDLIQHSWAGDS